MKRIWSPWRIQYILNEEPQGCVFCQKVKEGDEKRHLLLYKDGSSLVMMNKFPYTCGHLLVAPVKHTADLEDLEESELTDLFMILRKSVRILSGAMKPHGFNVGMNLGRIAGAGIEDHLHFHIVPRWKGDTNFMPVLTDSMVIPESLQGTYERLYPLFSKLREIA